MMILVDMNILSTFGKVGGLKLLFELFQTKLSVSSNVFCEISIAYEKEYSFAKSVLDCIKNEKIDVVAVDQEDLPYMLGLPKSFGPGDSGFFFKPLCLTTLLGIIVSFDPFPQPHS